MCLQMCAQNTSGTGEPNESDSDKMERNACSQSESSTKQKKKNYTIDTR